MKLAANDRQPVHDYPNAPPDWPTLLARLADNLARVVRAEILLLENRLGRNVAVEIKRAVAGAAAFLVLGLCAFLGVVCLLAGYVLLLHHWMAAWLACGAGGLTIIFLGLIAFAIIMLTVRHEAA
ncbi:MAG TPA: phage holin family protein [Candidatus Binataceae bacterium]|nr:phage holin family protein [Candidatus Binataceae bacterium]